MKYQSIANEIQKRIERKGLSIGDALPSERQLAKELGAAIGTVRLAYDYLYRQGAISRERGRGTFVAATDSVSDAPGAKGPRPSRRLGLILVEQAGGESAHPQQLIFNMMQACRDHGYELVIDFLDTDDLVNGQLPTMIRRRSVDGFFIYGRIEDHHVRYLEDQPLPFLLIGNRALRRPVPSVTLDAEGLAHDLTRELLKMGRRPIWLDVDPMDLGYAVGQEMLRGYTRALQEQGEWHGVLHLCPMSPPRFDADAAMLAGKDLSNAAYIVQDPTTPTFLAKLAARSKQFDQLLVAPLPIPSLVQSLNDPNVMAWSRLMNVGDLVVHSVDRMVEFLSGEQPRIRSVHIEIHCELKTTGPRPVMGLDIKHHILDSSLQEPAAPKPAPAAGWLS